ncbi:hypothetical protein IG631_17093 [Alternaria alternata]|nr:hypothetical protein IG631_17093 [Alternaria alternata]
MDVFFTSVSHSYLPPTDRWQQPLLLSFLTASRIMDPYAQIVQTKRKVQFAILHYSDLESGEVSDGIPVPFEINMGNGVVTNVMKDQIQMCYLGLAVKDLPELISDKHGVRGSFLTWLNGEG